MTKRALILPLVAVMVLSPHAFAQAAADGPLRSANKLEFEVASVRQNKSGDGQSGALFPLGPGDAYARTSGRFKATNLALFFYISFAYKFTASQQASLETQDSKDILWDKFDIDARSSRPDPSKDDMRQMMQSLLADRFKLRMHMESHEGPVFALILLKRDRTGPQLKPHPADEPCSATSPAKATGLEPAFQAANRGTLPQSCGGVAEYLKSSTPGYRRAGGRNVGIDLLAKTLSRMGDLGIPVIDRTSLAGTFDFILDWVPSADISAPTDQEATPNPPGPTFEDALQEQLGLKLTKQTAKTDVWVLDHVELPTAN
ncbi:MAG TPA: TIGR03435 family protein [Acidobacteriaceae bacterium]|jgi:uncharacterized protein (TIGR03435 family)|nr:TIGR03435 family protein [Acidobacteriaceae bacterium]